jgi:hypothetical protein
LIGTKSNLKRLQKKCDKKKWFFSEKSGKDLSGAMEYCDYCEEQTKSEKCMLAHEYRIKENKCASAYIKSKKKEK